MPEISRFFGILIQMFFKDHAPPHFHVSYQGHKAIIAIRTGDVLEGTLPTRQLRLVQAWAILHEDELLLNVETLSRQPFTFEKITPLA